MSVSSISPSGASPYVSTFRADEAQQSPAQNETAARTDDPEQTLDKSPIASQEDRAETYDPTGRLSQSPEDQIKATGTEEPDESDQDRTNATSESEDSEYTPEEEEEIEDLEDRDTEVKAHEQAHIAAGGRYVRGGAHLEYRTGPDGKQYAVGGEVSIDVSKESDPQATIAKMQTVARAAMAPAEPSSQDRAVAAKASRLEIEARAEAMAELVEETEKEGNEPQKAGKAQASDTYSATMDSSPKASQLDLFI